MNRDELYNDLMKMVPVRSDEKKDFREVVRVQLKAYRKLLDRLDEALPVAKGEWLKVWEGLYSVIPSRQLNELELWRDFRRCSARTWAGTPDETIIVAIKSQCI